jgi:hypothetical protein
MGEVKPDGRHFRRGVENHVETRGSGFKSRTLIMGQKEQRSDEDKRERERERERESGGGLGRY